METGVFHRGYSVVVRTVQCGKDNYACADDPAAEHGSYEYHVHTRADVSQR